MSVVRFRSGGALLPPVRAASVEERSPVGRGDEGSSESLLDEEEEEDEDEEELLDELPLDEEELELEDDELPLEDVELSLSLPSAAFPPSSLLSAGAGEPPTPAAGSTMAPSASGDAPLRGVDMRADEPPALGAAAWGSLPCEGREALSTSGAAPSDSSSDRDARMRVCAGGCGAIASKQARAVGVTVGGSRRSAQLQKPIPRRETTSRTICLMIKGPDPSLTSGEVFESASVDDGGSAAEAPYLRTARAAAPSILALNKSVDWKVLIKSNNCLEDTVNCDPTASPSLVKRDPPRARARL
jgi:hypothetical protein